MRNVVLLLFTPLLFVLSCQKEEIGSGTNIQDLFYVENKGAKMAVLVEGNIDSKVVVLFIHGGPGGTAIGFQNDENASSRLEPSYAVAYWEQRSAGISQGNGKFKFDLYVEDMAKVISVLKNRYGRDCKVFVLSHSWGGLIAPGYLTKENNQNNISGWINVAGAHNYYMNDSLTRDYLLSYGRTQVAANVHKEEWQEIVDFAEANVPNTYDYKLSSKYASCAFNAESLVDSIARGIDGGGIPKGLFSNPYPFSTFWMASNSAATLLSNLGDEIIYKEYSSKLHLITTPVLCITGKYDFTCPKVLGEEVINKVSSTKKKMIILQRSGHICMENEPEEFYNEVLAFIGENK
jgi:pimeloyl-ACP methyl ester carboxylesterase